MISQGEVWWAHLPAPSGSEPGFRHPVVVIQSNPYNHSPLRTAICVLLTSNLALAEAPGNLYLAKDETGLPRHSVANVTQVSTLDKRDLQERAGRLSPHLLSQVLRGVAKVLGGLHAP